jgi:hypothetical protein
LASGDLGPYAVWHTGEQRIKSRPPRTDCGFNVPRSGAEDLPSPVKDAIRFLNDHRQEVVVLRQMPGLDGLVLDFGVADREAARFDALPPALIRWAAEFGMGIEVSHYRAHENGGVG